MNYKTLVDLRVATQAKLKTLSSEQLNSEEGQDLLKQLNALNTDLSGYDREIASLALFGNSLK